jgi:hypothetical protein
MQMIRHPCAGSTTETASKSGCTMNWQKPICDLAGMGSRRSMKGATGIPRASVSLSSGGSSNPNNDKDEGTVMMRVQYDDGSGSKAPFGCNNNNNNNKTKQQQTNNK